MILTYRYRLLPTRRQYRALEGILESQRQLYNAALEERTEAYRKARVSRTYIDQTKGLTEWRQSDPEARALPVALQRATLKRLDEAYAAFFRRLPLPAEGVVKSCIFRREVKGWTISLMTKVPRAEPRERSGAVGLDLGIKTFAVMSNGDFIPSLKAGRRAERRVRLLQRALARKRHGSKGRVKARESLARCHAAAARHRNDFLHQTSAHLLRDFSLIAIEAINTKALARSRLAKEFHDASWGKFISMLRYKAERAGALLIEIDPRNTSQDCSECGTRVPKALGQRRHECPSCGLSIDRDLNAARNILNRAVAGPSLLNVVGYDMRAGGNLNSTSQVPLEARLSN